MTKSNIIDIESVFAGYLQREQQFEQEIEKRNKLHHKVHSTIVSKVSDSSSLNFTTDLEKSRIRNQTLLKDLEMSRARLRTYASYSPTNEELQQISSVYRNCLHKKIRNMKS